MNSPDLSTVAAGQIRDEMKKRIEVLIHQPPELTVRLKIAEACEWLRIGAAGRALEVLEELLAEFDRTDRTATEAAAWCEPMTATEARRRGLPVESTADQEKIAQEFVGRLPCGCPGEMKTLCPHGNSDLA